MMNSIDLRNAALAYGRSLPITTYPPDAAEQLRTFALELKRMCEGRPDLNVTVFVNVGLRALETRVRESVSVSFLHTINAVNAPTKADNKPAKSKRIVKRL